MMAARLLDGLERLDATGEEAFAAARLAFLEWIFAQPGVVTASQAREALNALKAEAPESDAGQAFLRYLRQASVPVLRPRNRTSAGRARPLN